MTSIKAKVVFAVVYEAGLSKAHLFNSEVNHESEGFKSRCDVIFANRVADALGDIKDTVFSRDLLGND